MTVKTPEIMNRQGQPFTPEVAAPGPDHEVRAGTLHVLEHASTAADAREPLGSLSLHESVEELDWTAVEEVAEPYKGYATRQADRVGTYVPAVAGAIAHEQDPSFAYTGPTATQIKQENVGARLISGFLGFFSPSWAARFDGYLERKARGKVQQVAQRAVAPLRAIATVETPRQQFVSEVADIYRRLSEKDESNKEDDPAEDRLPRLIRRIDGSETPVQTTREHWFTADRYPLLGKLLPALRLPMRSIQGERTIRAASPEIMKGVEQFLHTHGAEVASAQFAPFRSLTRKIIRLFAPKRLARVPDEVEAVLTQVYDILPEDGRKFTESVYALCKKVSTLAETGIDGKVITNQLIKSLWDY
jgi:hypothetical protein